MKQKAAKKPPGPGRGKGPRKSNAGTDMGDEEDIEGGEDEEEEVENGDGGGDEDEEALPAGAGNSSEILEGVDGEELGDGGETEPEG